VPVGVPRVLEEPAPGVGLNRFTPEGYELDLGWWVADPENGRGGVASEINKKVYALAKGGEIKLAFPGKERLDMESQILSHLAERSPS
jgi:small-conductance mechanosensitive channel